ncbi:MAG: formylmethanofuran dehydrogenase subunit A [Pseudomonadota bacterium]
MSNFIRLKSGRIYDPVNGVDGEVRDIFVRDGQIVNTPIDIDPAMTTYDLDGAVVMGGGIDIHTHIGGGKVNIARTMLPEDHDADPVNRGQHPHAGCGHAAPSTYTAGYRYAEMGYVACFEPAMLASNARQAHLEMADTPMVDKGAYVVLGNDDFFLRALRAKKDQQYIEDYVAWTLKAAQALAIKVVNPGGINAFKFNQRALDLDEKHNHYGITPREVLLSLSAAVKNLGVAHPLHIHGCNLGVPGNLSTTLETARALDGLPAHLTHVQFHAYGTEGDYKFSSGAAEIAEVVNRNPNLSMDVGQIMFGQTVTESGDTMRQFEGAAFAHPKKWVGMDIECDAGCGVVPFRYRDKNFVNALQWAIGLELFLLIDDPWRIFLTTDHPNGAPFTSYPHLIRLLMDRSFRNDMLSTIHPDAAAASRLGSIDREYSLYEIATMTRAAPARSLGLQDYGSLGVGARANITVYNDHANRERMFAKPRLVFKEGELIVENGKVCQTVWGTTHMSDASYDNAISKDLDAYFDRYMTMKKEHFAVHDDEFHSDERGSLTRHEVKRE